MIRCTWAGEHPLMIEYHDKEWGVPLHEEDRLFEFLVLEGAQAGLSWRTILEKRENYRKVFDHFDPAKVARYTDAKIKRLLDDPGIVRNRLKVAAAILNAQKTLEVQKEFGSLDRYLWQFVEGRPVRNASKTFKEVPCRSDLSDRMSQTLAKRGFKFVGTKICYAFMQAVGMVQDHTTDCFRYREINPL
ncbi:MAG: DNA-3-methyladenine glycosylase I [Nitrospirae bacterium]|nr:DNA-3-methyladenine glycosylase I [Candidatus Manganitrophaceae bacterium]